MLHGLATAIEMLHEEGLDNVFSRHARLAEATRRAVRAWGLEAVSVPRLKHPLLADMPDETSRWPIRRFRIVRPFRAAFAGTSG
jgi:aspartate aminotransferase-like enzyme